PNTTPNLNTTQNRGAPRLRRGAPSGGGYGGPFRGPPSRSRRAISGPPITIETGHFGAPHHDRDGPFRGPQLQQRRYALGEQSHRFEDALVGDSTAWVHPRRERRKPHLLAQLLQPIHYCFGCAEHGVLAQDLVVRDFGEATGPRCARFRGLRGRAVGFPERRADRPEESHRARFCLLTGL